MTTTTTRTIALLRGINVGGHKKIKMADLRAMMESLGYANVKTALASGNVAWDTDETDTAAMQSRIEQAIETTFGFPVPTQVIRRDQVEALLAADPFAGVAVTKDTRLYVTFLPRPVTPPFDLPHHVADGGFSILRVTDTDVCSVLTVSQAKTVDLMTELERAFGKDITTRNWNTVVKLATL